MFRSFESQIYVKHHQEKASQSDDECAGLLRAAAGAVISFNLAQQSRIRSQLSQFEPNHLQHTHRHGPQSPGLRVGADSGEKQKEGWFLVSD